MITIPVPDNSPIEIKTNNGTVIVTVDKTGKIKIKTYQRNGKREYYLGYNVLDGALVEVK